MSAQPVRVVPRVKRLRVTAKLQHETLRFEGDIFEFIHYLMREQLTGTGTFHLNRGHADYGLEFNLKDLVTRTDEQIAIDEPNSSMP